MQTQLLGNLLLTSWVVEGLGVCSSSHSARTHLPASALPLTAAPQRHCHAARTLRVTCSQCLTRRCMKLRNLNINVRPAPSGLQGLGRERAPGRTAPGDLRAGRRVVFIFWLLCTAPPPTCCPSPCNGQRLLSISRPTCTASNSSRVVLAAQLARTQHHAWCR